MSLKREHLTVVWSPELEEKLRIILRAYRFSAHGDTSSEMHLRQSLRTEAALLNQTLKELQTALSTAQPLTLDLGVLEALDRLQLAHESRQSPTL